MTRRRAIGLRIVGAALALVAASCSAADVSDWDEGQINPARMIIDEVSFPTGWYHAGGLLVPGHRKLGQRDSSAAEFRHPTHAHVASHEVYCFRGVGAAEYAFAVLGDPVKAGHDRSVTWREPPGPISWDTTADESTATCAEMRDLLYLGRTPLCRAVSRYGTCVSEFEAWIDPIHMSYEHLHAIRTEIENRVAAEVLRANLAE